MAAVGNTSLTLVDLASRMENGKVTQKIVEILSETNEMIVDMPFQEANDGSNHKSTIRSGLPNGTWRKLNYGVQPTKSTTVQVKDACGMLENYSKVDAALVSLAKDKAAFRLSEDKAFIEGMNQNFMDTAIYGDTSSNPERFMGFAPRYNSLSAENGSNVISGAGAGSDNTSIWLVVWGDNTCHGIYPAGSQAGLVHKDLGEDTVSDGAGGEFQAFRTHYKWDCGLVLRDWRYVVRISNIDVSDLTKNAATGADLCDLMVQAMEIVPNLGMGTPVFYCNRTVKSYLRRQLLNKSNLLLSMDELAGKPVLTFGGIPVRKCDAILNTEAAVA